MLVSRTMQANPMKVQFLWQSHVLKGEGLFNSSTVDLSHLSLPWALKTAHPHLTFLELAGLFDSFHKKNLEFSPEDLFRIYDFSLDAKLRKLLGLLGALPIDFYQWAQVHGLSPKDLQPLLSLPSVNDLKEPLILISELNPSRSSGSQLLELLVECFLIENSTARLIPQLEINRSPEKKIMSWLEHLKALRFPQTMARDQQRQKKILALPWSKDLNSRWVRSGDKSGVELKFLISTKKDLQDKISQLQRVCDDYVE